MIIKDSQKKAYDYYSRYGELSTIYNTVDAKRYYELSKPLKNNITQWVNHTVQPNDTLDTIALKYYSNPLFWWIIADVNNILNPFELREGMTLKIPYLSQVKF